MSLARQLRGAKLWGACAVLSQVFAAHGQRNLSDINSTMSEGENWKNGLKKLERKARNSKRN
jgi:hypothetical protein